MPVQDHMMKMIALFWQVHELGGSFYAKEYSDMVLARLTLSFQPFKLNLSISNKDCTLIGLINVLKVVEIILKLAPVVHLTSD